MPDLTAPALPKYVRIRDYLKRAITAGQWAPGEQLPTCRELTQQFDVTPMTVWRALDELDKEQLIDRQRGSGIYVREAAPVARTGLIGVIMQTEGDTFGRIYSQLLRQLGAAGHHAIATDIGGYDHLPEERARALAGFLGRGTDVLVVDGRTFMPFTLLREWHQPGRQLTFLLRRETTLAFPGANRILADWEAGGRLVAEHLLAQGARRLLVFSHAYPGARTPGLGPEYQFHWELLRGVKAVLAEAGLAADTALRLVLDAPGLPVEDDLRQALREGCDGVFCLGDFRAPKVYRAAAAEGLAIGRDVRVCGYFDTPWAAALHPALTSVHVQEDLLAATAAEAVVGRWHDERVLIAPVLRPRESTMPAEPSP
jgi:DNA-binding LacI/PurR family transcriptional regulator